MIRTLTVKGATAGVQVGVPPPGFRWRVLSAVVVLNGSATVGARSANLNLGPMYQSQSAANLTLAITSQGSTSASTTSTGIGGTSPAGAADTVTTWTAFPILSRADQIFLSVTLQSGDTVNAYLVVDEVLDE